MASKRDRRRGPRPDQPSDRRKNLRLRQLLDQLAGDLRQSRRDLDQNRRDLDVQFTRIAQMQAELDALKRGRLPSRSS